MPRDSTNLTALTKVLAHFTLKELKELVIPVFEGKISTKEAMRIISTERLSLSAKSMREVLLNVMKEERRRYVQDKIFYLKLLDVAIHERRTWTSWKLTDVAEEAGDHWMEENLLLDKIKHSFNRENLFGAFKVLMQKGIFWIMICIKLKNMDRGIKYHPPIFFAYIPGDVYLFTSRKGPKDVFSCLTKSVLGYNKLGNCFLTGRSVNSLFRLLKNKEQKACSWRDVDEEFVHRNLTSVDVTESTKGLDFTQHRKRRTYAKNCIGENPPVLHSYIVKAKNNKWKGNSVVSHFVGRDLDTILILKSKNISLTVEKLIVYGVITTPAPPHFEKLNSLGVNDLLIVPNDESEEDFE